MNRILASLILALGLSGATGVVHSDVAQDVGFGPTDAEFRQMMIRASIRAYSDSCVCPHSLASDGSQCSEQNVYSEAEGDKPLCFERDVDEAMVEEFRSNLK